jgi:hypothetical protein
MGQRPAKPRLSCRPCACNEGLSESSLILSTGFAVTVLEAAKATPVSQLPYPGTAKSKWLFLQEKATLTEAKTGAINCETGLDLRAQ